MTETLFDVSVPKSAHCPHWHKGRFVAGHVPIIGTTEKPRRKKPPRCKICRRPIEWSADLQLYVTPYTIEEIPW